jgi:hypothetical protein
MIKSKTIEKKLEEGTLKAIENKEPLNIVEDKYRNYMTYVLDLEKYKFHHLPKSFSELTDNFIKYKKEVNQDGK